jgi:hypothetical protein
MALIKLGEAISILPSDIRNNIFDDDQDITLMFQKEANDFKAIAPKAKDFLYFTCVMMHAAEASLIDEKGALKKKADGSPVEAKWVVNANGSWVWDCNDAAVMPYRNNNRDIFPEPELKKAYKKWVKKPLCVDHRSQEAEMVRGIIIDTFYDDKYKRVIALCALDKINYPDLAHKVATGYSASVSMGTAVGKAVCTEKGCHRVARTEMDFCDHMKKKSCYGEINTELEPLELSIVVNPADPRAKIKHIVAAADTLARYVSLQDGMFAKQASTDNNLHSLVELMNDEMDTFESSMEASEMEASEKQEIQDKVYQVKGILSDLLKKLPKADESSEVSEAYEQRSSKEMKDTDLENTDRSYNIPGRFAKDNLLKSLKDKVGQLDKLINNMAFEKSPQTFNEENKMATEKKSYFQGGGGVNEPAPKQTKYPKEEADKVRNTEDKHMVGAEEPGTDGLMGDDEAKKKLLLRAEVEERRLRRQAAVEKAQELLKNKKAYMLGGGAENEPTPGKAKYPKEDSDKIRDKEDKQMTGAAPFPGVGKVDGLYGDDLKKKEMVSRAKLSARFVKAADSRSSRWDVFAGDKLILSATVNELAQPYEKVATKEFGKAMISTIKREGFNAAIKLYKSAQAVAAPGALPAAPADAAPAAEVPMDMPMEAPLGDSPVDTGEAGDDPALSLKDKLDEMDGLLAECKKAVEALAEEDLSGPEMDAIEAPKTAGVSLPAMRRTLHAALVKGFKQAIAELSGHIDEMQLMSHVYKTASNKDSARYVANLSKAASEDAKQTVANVYKLMSAFVKYARGAEEMQKKAQYAPVQPGSMTPEPMLPTKATPLPVRAPNVPGPQGSMSADDSDESKLDEEIERLLAESDSSAANDPFGAPEMPKDPFGNAIDATKKKEQDKKPGAPVPPAPPVQNADTSCADDEECKEDECEADDNDVKLEVEVPDQALKVKANRAELRAKLAQKGEKFSDVLKGAHPGGKATTKLDIKPSGDLGVIEDMHEIHDKMMDVATAAPRHVREAAAEINRLVVAGKINPTEEEFTHLVRVGLDGDAVKYWKQYYAQAKDSEASSFAADLVKETAKKKADQEIESHRVKLARSFELANTMASKGIITGTREAINAQVNDLMKYNDESFKSVASMVEKLPAVKTASMPVVGQSDSMISQQVITETVKTSSSKDLAEELTSIFSNVKGRNF